MQPKTPKLLADIQDAASFILDFTRGKTVDDYRRDRPTRQTVERNFEIIGEAVNRLTRIDPAVAAHISSARQIVAFRNVLIHGYDLVDDQEVWKIITNSLPKLLAEIQALMPVSES
jgi:uncharacterized protein with HEPN domain